MKKLFVLVLAILGLTACSDVDTGSVDKDQHEAAVSAAGMDFFHGSWQETLQKANSENKKIFVDVYTTWCGPCKLMAANIFPLKAVGDFYNARFINIKLDAEDEEVNGPELAEQYKVKGFPTYLFLNADGSEIGRAVGVMEAEQFVSLAGQLLGEHKGNYDQLLARYESGERSVEFIRQLLNGAQLQMSLMNDREKSYALSKRMKKVAEEYVASRGKENLINEEDFSIITSYWSKSLRGDEMAEFVIDNYDAFVAVAPESAVSQFVLDSNWYGALDASEKGDSIYRQYIADYDGKLAKAVAYSEANDNDGNSSVVRAKSVFNLNYLVATKAWDELHQLFEQQLKSSPAARSYIWAARELSKAEDLKYQTIALEYADKGYEMGLNDAFDVVTYSGLLKKAGRDEEADKVLEEYRNSLGDSAADKRSRNLLERMTQPPAVMTVEGVFTLTDAVKESRGVKPDTVVANLWKLKAPGSESKGLVEDLINVPVVDGKFTFQVPVDAIRGVGLAILANDGKMTLAKADLIMEPGKVVVNLDTRDATGSKYYQQVIGSWKNSSEYKDISSQMSAQGEKIVQETDLPKRRALYPEFNRLKGKVGAIAANALQEMIKNNPDPNVQFLALGMAENGLNASERLNRMKQLTGSMSGSVPLQNSIARLEEALASRARANAIKVGTVIKDFEAEDLQGKSFKVSDVMAKNKYVLVEFWASWCGPCRAEIPHMKEAYKSFHSKGFEIVSFTLDDSKENWEDASEEESLPWLNIGDLKAFDSPIVKMYGVQGVPANYLVEGATGKIVGKDLRQQQLDNKLAELLDES